MKRYLHIVEFYTLEAGDIQAKEASQEIVNELNEKYDCNAKTTELGEMPFAGKAGDYRNIS